MTTDATKPIAPLDPQLVAHLGQPQTRIVVRSDGRDLEVVGWEIGVGRIGVGSADPSTWQRGTDVEIFLTAKGRLITTRNSWTRTPQGRSDSQTSQFHETPAAALQWLVDDGKGKLGPASKAAWVQACRTFAPMAGLEFERID